MTQPLTIQPLVDITGPQYFGHEWYRLGTEEHYEATCRDCGPLRPVVKNGQSLHQAGLVRDRHLAEHLKALAQEIAEAAR